MSKPDFKKRAHNLDETRVESIHSYFPDECGEWKFFIENLTAEEAELITASIQKIAKKHEVEIKELKTITTQDKPGL